MAKEYAYKRYQLSLDINDLRHKPIIEYLDSFTGGKARNGALVKLLLNAMNGTNSNETMSSQTNNMLTEYRLSRMEDMIDSLMATLNNKDNAESYASKDVADTKENKSVSEDKNTQNESNQVPGQLFFDDVNIEIKDENSDSTFGSNAAESEIVPNKEDNIDKITLDTENTADEISKEMVASAFGMPSPSSNDEAKEGIEDDDIYLPDGVMDFLDSL